MRIFLSVASLKPGYGGPARSVPRLARALAEHGAEVGLWAADGSASDAAADHPHVRWLAGTVDEALATFGRADVIHDNGIWLPHNHRLAMLASRRGIPRIVSTRGMLEPWALRHKRCKKLIAWWLYQRHDLATARAYHVTSDAERKTIEAFGWSGQTLMIPNGVDLPDISGRSGCATSRTALFVGRLHPVKGLSVLLEAWSRAKPDGWTLRIVGPDEAGHQKTLESDVARLGLGRWIAFSGPLDGDALHHAYQDAALFILPSHTENFGMAVAEALAHELPVITTHGTPWSCVADESCGWWVVCDPGALAAAIGEAAALAPGDLHAMGARGRTMVARRFSWDTVASSFLDGYATVVRSLETRVS